MKIETGASVLVGVLKHDVKRGQVYAPIFNGEVDTEAAFLVTYEDTNKAVGFNNGNVYNLHQDFNHDRRFYHFHNAKVVLEP